jgi:hypothetical protein
MAEQRYILFISFIGLEMVMSEPNTRKPTKKAFHLPKNANAIEDYRYIAAKLS